MGLVSEYKHEGIKGYYSKELEEQVKTLSKWKRQFDVGLIFAVVKKNGEFFCILPFIYLNFFLFHFELK